MTAYAKPALVGLFAFLCASVVDAQETPSKTIDKPVVQVGEAWSYRVTDRGKPNEKTITRQIDAIDGDRIRIRRTESGQPDQLEIRNRDWNLLSVESPAGAWSYNPFYASYAFPMAPGEKWKQSFRSRNPDGSETQYEFEAEVVGWEKLTVLAGPFDALKVRTVTSYTEKSSGGRIEETYWWAAGPAREIKREYRRTRSDSRPEVDQTYELIEFKTAP
jgi:hypothetical protein